MRCHEPVTETRAASDIAETVAARPVVADCAVAAGIAADVGATVVGGPDKLPARIHAPAFP